MVGIPTRSLSCLTCRRRKKKCDKTAPTCLKCEKAGIECEGYTDGLVWVNRTVDNRPKLQIRLRQQQQPQQHHHHASSSVQDQQLIVRDDSSASGGSSPGSAWTTDRSDDVVRSPDILLPVHLARSAREQLYMGYFGSTLLAAGTTTPSDAAMSFASMGWTKHIGPLYDTDPAVRCAAMATSSAIVATLHNDKQLQVKGIQAYNGSVMEMVKGLQRTDWYKRDGLLTAARIMATFELLFISKDKDTPEPLAWRGHNQGQQAIFLARGPSAFSSGPAHQLYADARINMVMLSMGQRKRSPFATPAWDKIPWLKHPKAVKDELIDVMQDIPEILEYIEEFKVSKDAGRRRDLEMLIMSRSSEVQADLDSWAADRGDSLQRFDCFAHIGPLEPPRNDAEYAFHHMTTIYWFTAGMVSCIKSFFSSRQGEERIPERPPGWYANYGGTGPGTPGSTTATNTTTHDDNDAQSPSSTSSTTGVSASEHYLWESAVYATREVYAMGFFLTPDAGVAHSAAGLMSLAVILRYYLHPAAFCILGNEVEILQSLYAVPILGIPVGQLLRRVLGGHLPPLVANLSGPRVSHGLGWF
ncbi:Zn(2)-C6 fungal-type DNA-binding domain protein [Cordyceps fumosorosea ARSEF 2679]|uniref:Zn(2)-C6 fungal-type DNA-binding domain protein n=1 Tax=Cordyceps fumosorosea (strain ARSEF 2679) TaxID=1081104 RepID=A0A162KS61_CORFA|nr:Zn(2)-C6 fungal-type DNA-binding domain protein [Cordyceps fumosorosea ARSEF 2679]OAA66324.1 Zn(2)-C6 fungal-type DNA-binding domain protein [Cordyceps fumosorosea ARSEF 2679]